MKRFRQLLLVLVIVALATSPAWALSQLTDATGFSDGAVLDESIDLV